MNYLNLFLMRGKVLPALYNLSTINHTNSLVNWFSFLKSNIKLSFILPILQFFDDQCLKYRKTLNSINSIKLRQLIFRAT